MDLYRLLAFAHIFFAVVLVGMALFWFVMLAALRRRFDPNKTAQLLDVANDARWPHVLVPYRLRLALPWLNWVIIVILFGTGVALLKLHPVASTPWWWTKLALLAVVVTFQMIVTKRPRPSLIRAHLVVVLAVMLVSGLLLR